MRSTIYASYYWRYLSYSQPINKYLCIFTFAWILFFVYAVAVWFQFLQTFFYFLCFWIWGFMWRIMIQSNPKCILFIYLFYCDLDLAPCISDLEISQHTWLTVFSHLEETRFIC